MDPSCNCVLVLMVVVRVGFDLYLLFTPKVFSTRASSLLLAYIVLNIA